MTPAETRRGAMNGDVGELDHWTYGVIPGVGYTTKAFSQGLDAGLYDPYLRGHYTPIRAATAQTTEDPIDLRMIHPIRTGREILLSRITRGPLDEAGRPTFTNHTVVGRTDVLRSGRTRVEGGFRSMHEFDQEVPDVQGEISLLKVPQRSEADGPLRFGDGIHKHTTF